MKFSLLKQFFIFLSVLIINFFYCSEIYFDKLANESPSKFVSESDRFLSEANSEKEKLHILYFTARAWYHLKDEKNAVENLLILERRLPLFEKKNPVESTKLYGKLAYLYTYLKYSFKTKVMLENSNRISMLLTNEKDFHEARAYFYFYTAIINGINAEYDYSFQNYKKADQEYRLLAAIDINRNPRFGHSIAVNLADTYMFRGELKKALEFNNVALQRFNDEKYSGVAYLNIGTIYSKLNKRDSALIFYKKSINPLRAESHIPYLNESFDSIKSIYLSKNDLKRAKYYSDAQKQTLKKLEKIGNIAINRLEENNEANEIFENRNAIYALLIFLVLLTIITAARRIRNRKTVSYKRKVITIKSDDLRDEASNSKSKREQFIDNNYHEKILERLLEYERTHFFLDTNITLSKVAVNLDTNTQTL